MTDKTERIRALNDRLRQTGRGGRIMATAGVVARGPEFVQAAMAQIAAYSDFSPDNDPYQEHDFGVFELPGTRLFWKIDYYDPSLSRGCGTPWDEEICARVLTVMLAEDY